MRFRRGCKIDGNDSRTCRAAAAAYLWMIVMKESDSAVGEQERPLSATYRELMPNLTIANIVCVLDLSSNGETKASFR